MKKKLNWKVLGVVAMVLLIGSFVYANQAANRANEGVVIEPHIKGNPDATVTVTEYSDFQCPACGQAYAVVEAIMEQYGEQVRFEYKHFPLMSIHPYAVPAARAAEAAAQQGKFWEMHDKLFENQTLWSQSANPQLAFNQYAEEIGLDMDLYKTHLNASVINDAIRQSFANAQSKGYTGTPTFELNGERVQFSSYQELIDQVAAAVAAATGEVSVQVGSTTVESNTTSGEEVKFGI